MMTNPIHARLFKVQALARLTFGLLLFQGALSCAPGRKHEVNQPSYRLTNVGSPKQGPEKTTKQPPSPNTIIHYEVKSDLKREQINVRACFPSSLPKEIGLARPYRKLISQTQGTPPESSGKHEKKTITSSNGRFSTRGFSDGACFDYSFGLQDYKTISPARMNDRKFGESWLLAATPWLLRPYGKNNVEADLCWTPSADEQIATPWKSTKKSEEYRQQEDDSTSCWHLPRSSFRWPNSIVLGDFGESEFEAAGSNFRITHIDECKSLDGERLQEWIRVAAETVAELYGNFPVPSLRVYLVPTPYSTSSVAFGLTMRGGGPAILLLVNPSASSEALNGEWVTIHEFLHLGHPLMKVEDAWMSEGMVTYYTEVLRKRYGLFAINEREGKENPGDIAIQQVLSGFKRAQRTKRDRTLSYMSTKMHDIGTYVPVYWGGAAIVYELDRRLREASNQRLSFDDVAQRLHATLVPSTQRWPALKLLSLVDEYLHSRDEELPENFSLREQAEKLLASHKLPPLALDFIEHPRALP